MYRLKKDNSREDSASSQFSHLKGLELYNYPPAMADVQSPGGGPSHRKYTHLGWYKDYSNDYNLAGWENTWQKKRKILLGTVKKVFNFNPLVPAAIEYKIGYSKKTENFAAIIYYIHLLGDHMEIETPKNYADNLNYENTYLLPLTTNQFGYEYKTAIIPSLIYHLEKLFGKKSDKLTEKLRNLENEIELFFSTHGSFDTQNDIEKYKEYVKQVYEVLCSHLPGILENEPWFRKVFYPNYK